MPTTSSRLVSRYSRHLLFSVAASCSLHAIARAQESSPAEAASTAQEQVSFAEIIDRQFGKGVAPETNALAKIYEAIGPRPEGTFQGEEYFRRLGIPVPSDNGSYYQEFGQGLAGEASRTALEAYGKAMNGLWTEKQYPDLAKWLQENEKLLQIVNEGTLRQNWYYPVVQKTEDGKPTPLIALLLPHVQKMRGLARAFLVRANLHLANNEPEKAWADLQTCHRLGRLTAKGPTLIDFLVGVAINSIATHGELRLLSETKLTEQQIDKFLGDLATLPQMPQVSVNINVTERMMFNDSISLMRDGHLNVSELTGDSPSEKSPFEQPILRALIDWDVVLKRGNEAYDELVAILEMKDVAKRRDKLAEFDQKWTAIRSDFTTSSLMKEYLRTGSASSVVTERMADAMIALLTPALRGVDNAQLRSLQTNENLMLAMQLAKFKVRTGSYPDTLADLEKELSIKVSPDLCSGAPMHYTKTETGYVLYSVGTNGIDEGGKSWNDPPLNSSGIQGDDNVVRMPLPKEN